MPIQNLNIKVEVFREDDLYVALCPSLNVSSYGESVEGGKNRCPGHPLTFQSILNLLNG